MRPAVTSTSNDAESISIHASHAGCDVVGFSGAESDDYFNPRIPCGMRLQFFLLLPFSLFISIHASHAGCDLQWLQINSLRYGFQSTHPMRDATFSSTLKTALKSTISIHASHAGCDCLHGWPLLPKQNFNPRIPCGMRPWDGNGYNSERDFNPRIPCGMRRTALLSLMI